jgi:Family of unknown function (DUF6529)
MEGFFDELTGGNTTEVKVVLASIVAALAFYQVALMAVGWGRVKLPFLTPPAASIVHRAIGDSLVVIIVLVAVMCVSYFEVEDDATLHVIAAIGLLVALAFKIVVVRWWHGLSRLLPALGITVWALIGLTVATSAGSFLADK